jgi:CRP-like cAMP-binding protein
VLAEALIDAVKDAALPSWTFQPGAFRPVAGLPPSGLCLVRKGYVVRVLGGAGLDLVGPGQGFATLELEPHVDIEGEPTSSYAIADSVVWAIGEKSLDLVLQRAPLAAVAYRALAQTQARLDRLTAARSRTTAPERIGELLHVLANEAGVCPPLRQRDIATLLGMRLETTSRGLRVLQDAGATQPWRQRGGNTVDRGKLSAFLASASRPPSPT